ncbi:unnamed protein product [Schistosoma turkestanicum]|nr:unnamed protein product [Schistosoma turkestanicum]
MPQLHTDSVTYSQLTFKYQGRERTTPVDLNLSWPFFYPHRMIKSTCSLPESSPTVNKSNCDNNGQRNTVGSLNNVVVVTIPSVNLTNSSTPVIVASQSINTMSNSCRNSRTNGNYNCSCKESASHHSHRSNHFTSGVHSSHFHHHSNHHHQHHHHHHHHHANHKENYTSHNIVECNHSSSAIGTAGNGTSLNHHYSSYYSTSHQTVPTFQQNRKHNSFHGKWKPGISRHLQEFMISQWEQFHAHLSHSNYIDAKSCCFEATPTTTTTLTTTVVIINQPTTLCDSNNNDSPLSSNDMTSSRTSLSDNSSSGQITNAQSTDNNNNGNNSPSTIESNIVDRSSSSSRGNDLPITLTTTHTTTTTTTVASDITHEPSSSSSSSSNSSNNNVSINSCGSYPRRKQSYGYVTNQIGKSMNAGPLGWKRNQNSGRKNSSPGNFSSRCPINYFTSRNSSFIMSTTTTTTSNNLLPVVVTYTSSSTTLTTTTPSRIVDSLNINQMNIHPVTTVPDQPNTQSSNVIDFKTTTSMRVISSSSSSSISEISIQQNVSSSSSSPPPPISSSTYDSIAKVDDISNSSTVTNSIMNPQNLEIKTENIDKVSEQQQQQHLSNLHLTSNDNNNNNNTVDQLNEDIPVDKSSSPKEERVLTSTSILKVDEEIAHSISCGKIEEGECYWTPDPPASPNNNTTSHHENHYSSSYHSVSLSPSPPRLSASMPSSNDLQSIVYHPPLSIHTELSSLPDFHRCNQPGDSPFISSSNNSRLESLNDVD